MTPSTRRAARRPPPASSERDILLHAVRPGPPGRVGDRLRRAAAADSRADRPADPVRRVRRLSARREARRAAHRATRSAIPDVHGLPAAAVRGHSSAAWSRRSRRVVVGDVDDRPALHRGRARAWPRRSRCRSSTRAKSIGALNILSRERDSYSERDAAHPAAVRGARRRPRSSTRGCSSSSASTPRRSRRSPRSAAKSRPCSISTSCSRASRSSTRRVVDYRTFGILLLNEATQELEMKVAVQYGEKVDAAEGAARRRASSATRRSIAKRCSCRTCRRIRATSRSSTTCGRSWRCRCC